MILNSPANATISTGTGVRTIKDDGTGTGGTNDDRPVKALPATYSTLEDSTLTLSGISVANPDPTRTVTVVAGRRFGGAQSFPRRWAEGSAERPE